MLVVTTFIFRLRNLGLHCSPQSYYWVIIPRVGIWPCTFKTLQIFYSGHSNMNGFTLLCEVTKTPEKNTCTNNYHDIMHHAMKKTDHWETESKQGRPYNCLERICRVWHKEGKLRQSFTDSKVENTKLKVWEDQNSQTSEDRILERSELHRELIPGITEALVKDATEN